jgi:hypothetical protein
LLDDSQIKIQREKRETPPMQKKPWGHDNTETALSLQSFHETVNFSDFVKALT